MRKSRFTEEQIVATLQDYAAGARVSELYRKHGMSDVSFYNWKAKYGDLRVSDMRRLKDHETTWSLHHCCHLSHLQLLWAVCMTLCVGQCSGGAAHASVNAMCMCVQWM